MKEEVQAAAEGNGPLGAVVQPLETDFRPAVTVSSMAGAGRNSVPLAIHPPTQVALI